MVACVHRGMEQRIDALAQRAGLVIRRRVPPSASLGGRALRDLGITLVLDVGANVGQYAQWVRETGFAGRIVSFEPLREEFAQLGRAAAEDPGWEVRNEALGDLDGEAEIHVSQDSVASSFLDLSDYAKTDWPWRETNYVERQPVKIQRLDTLAPVLLRDDDRTLLKLDVQGYEMAALRGAEDTLDRVAAVQCELSLVELYEGQPRMWELLRHLDARGFRPIGLEPVVADPATGHQLQLDGLFVRRDSTAR